MSSLPPSSPPSLSSEFQPTPRDDSDPFGFLALERKLKEQRAQHRPPLIHIDLPTSAPRASPPPQSPHAIVSPPSTPSPLKPPSKKPNPIHNTKHSVAHDDSDPAAAAGPSTPLRRSQRQRGSKAPKSTLNPTQNPRKPASASKKRNNQENSERSRRSRTTKSTLTARRTRLQKTGPQVAKNEPDNVDEDQREVC